MSILYSKGTNKGVKNLPAQSTGGTGLVEIMPSMSVHFNDCTQESHRRGGFTAMGKYILDLGDNDAKTMLGIFNLPLAHDVWDAMSQMRLMMGEKLHGPHRVEKYFEHVVFRPAKGEHLTRAQYDEMKAAVLKRLGYENCPRVEWEDALKGGIHQHMCILRMDMEGNLVHPYRRFEACIDIAHEFERKFGLKSSIKSESKNVYYNAKAEIVALWQKTEGMNGLETREAFERNGFILTRGDRGQYLLVSTKTGHPHNPARIPELKKHGLNEAGARQRFSGIAITSLPSVQQVRAALNIASHATKNDKHRGKTARAYTHKTGAKYLAGSSRLTARPVASSKQFEGIRYKPALSDSKPVSSTTIKKSAKKERAPVPCAPTPCPPLPITKRGWPEAAQIEWELWGHKNPAKFFALWPELAPPRFQPVTLD